MQIRQLALILIVSMLFAPTAFAVAPNIEMVFVKGGCYQMGDTFGDGSLDAKPVHRVCVNDFSIGKYPVTQAQWQAVMGVNPSISKLCGDNCPVETVNYDDALRFIDKLNGLTGKKYRLPYESEWEYAARSGGRPERWAGTSNRNELEDYAWFADNSQQTTHPVGLKKPNGLGIYDMSGNVWEWCNDWYGEKYYSESPVQNPHGPSSGPARVLRGGSWYNQAGIVRADFRGYLVPAYRNFYYGFRLVLPAVQ